MNICIIGLGYIGLPTAAMFSTHGHKVLGVDINKKVIDALNQGKVIIEEPYLEEMVNDAVKGGTLKASEKPDEADAFIICVPTPIRADKTADLSYVENAARMIIPYLKKGNIVILESTSPPGTTRDFLGSIFSHAGFIPGEDIYLAYCPERVLPGRILIELKENSRVVGGINEESARVVKELYKSFVEGEIYTSEATTAEMCKLMENTYRDVNIALANELAMLCEKMRVNAWDVIKFANKHPRVNLHMPGPGVGGHCIAVDPWFIVEKQPEIAKIITLARDTNDGMPQHVLGRIEALTSHIEGKKKILILGVTYKPDVDDMRESPIIELIGQLKKEGVYNTVIVDKHVDYEGSKDNDLYEAAKNAHLIVLAVNHSEYKNIDFARLKEAMNSPKVLDTRNFWDRDIVEQAGLEYHLLGCGRNQF
ncbi:MAG: nucleotide sugar dehydrogenase [Clostridiaceae bacterium]|jgi:UDP-N-acetyl-D-mannosaminuronic acid dehydrogenase|nr:nucleotide sugar dehydrogenase [Clostridiaceae bacterium]